MINIPEEIVARVFEFLTLSDRKTCAVVCKKWYRASRYPRLMNDVLIHLSRRRPEVNNAAQRKLFVNLSLIEVALSGKQIVAILKDCAKLKTLSLSRCNDLFFTDSFLKDDKDIEGLRAVLINLIELDISAISHLSNSSFKRIVSIAPNLSSLNISGCPILFSEGFLNTSNPNVVLTFSTILDYIASQAGQIKCLCFNTTGITNVALSKLAQIPGLRLSSISLENCRELGDAGIVDLVKHQNCLEKIYLSGCTGITTVSMDNIAAKLSKLRVLDARKCVQLVKHNLAVLHQAEKLTDLDISECHFLTRDSLNSCFSNSNDKFPFLTKLSLKGIFEVNDSVVQLIASSISSLQHLDLTSCSNISDFSVEIISGQCVQLTYLSLAWCKRISNFGLLGINLPQEDAKNLLSDSCPMFPQYHKAVDPGPIFTPPENDQLSEILESGNFPTVGISNLQKLRFLDLSDCPRVSDIATVFGISKLPLLQVLKLSRVHKLTDDSLVAIAKNLTVLECLHIAMSNVTNAGLGQVFSQLSRLRELDCSACDNITDQVIYVMTSCPRALRTLDISFCGGISPFAVNILEESMPSLSNLTSRMVGSKNSCC